MKAIFPTILSPLLVQWIRKRATWRLIIVMRAQTTMKAIFPTILSPLLVQWIRKRVTWRLTLIIATRAHTTM